MKFLAGKKYLTTLICVLISGIVPVAIHAQDTSLSEQITVERRLRVQFPEVNKIEVNVLEEEEEVSQPTLTYNVEPMLLEMPVFTTPIRPVPVRHDRQPLLYRNYAKLGFGNYGSIYGEFFYNTVRSKENLLAIHLKHFSGKGPVDFSNFREDLLELYGKKNFKNHILSGNLIYSNNQNHFYGIGEGDTLDYDKKELRQVFNNFEFNTGFNNSKSDSENIHYELNGRYYFFKDRYDASENNLLFKALASDYFNGNLVSAYGAVEHNIFGFEQTGSQTMFKAGASYNISQPQYFVRLGFHTATPVDTGGNGAFGFFPDVEAEIKLADEHFIAFAGMRGDKELNTFRGFARENPFVVSGISLQPTSSLLELFGGVKGSLTSRLSFYGRLGYQSIENLPYYLNDSLNPKRFTVVYDSINTTLMEGNIQVMYEITDVWKLGLLADLRNFSAGSESRPWYRPGTEVTFTTRYNLQNKIIFTGDVFVIGKRYAKNLASEEITRLNGLIDLNAGINYRFSPVFTAFIDFKNILGNRYELFHPYPVRGFHLLAGLTVDFGR
ncbi:MAG: hypothetical protein WD077_15825 [Bacteroidia bacterium]